MRNALGFLLTILTAFLIAAVALPSLPSLAFAHCQMPCGIYGDEMRFQELDEHVATLEKAMTQIQDLSDKSTPQDVNQLVRWISTKDQHAEEVQEIMNAYFFTQRVKPVPADDAGYADYLESLRLIHEITVIAMKCKQTVDPANVHALGDALASYKAHYFKDKEHDHE